MLSDEEIIAFVDSNGAARRGVQEAIILLDKKKAITGDPVENRRLTVQLLRLEGRLADLRADDAAFAAETLFFAPPRPEDVQRMKELATTLDRYVAGATAARTIITTVTRLLEEYDKLEGGDA